MNSNKGTSTCYAVHHLPYSRLPSFMEDQIRSERLTDCLILLMIVSYKISPFIQLVAFSRNNTRLIISLAIWKMERLFTCRRNWGLLVLKLWPSGPRLERRVRVKTNVSFSIQIFLSKNVHFVKPTLLELRSASAEFSRVGFSYFLFNSLTNLFWLAWENKIICHLYETK